MDTSADHPVIYWWPESTTITHSWLIAEEPLSIRVQGKPYSVVMRTPGDEIPHVAGFCLAEGIVDTPDDLNSLAFCDGSDTNVVTVTLNPDRRAAISKILERRGFISQTSCGICGKELVEDLSQRLRPLTQTIRIDPRQALASLANLSAHQPLRRKTRTSHAAALFTGNLELLSIAEDVGRHNALDKAIGKLFLERTLDKAAVLIISSRISYELVQKAARASIPIILALSRPTELAVNLATRLNMTLACLNDGSGLAIFGGAHRLRLNQRDLHPSDPL